MTALGSVLKVEARDALIFTGSSMLYQLGSLVLLPIYWSRLSPADFGILAVISVIGAFQALLSSLSREIRVEPDDLTILEKRVHARVLGLVADPGPT